MKQLSFSLATPSDLTDCLKAIERNSPETASSILFLLFSGWTDQEATFSISRELRNAFPDAVIAGASTAGEIHAGTLRLHTLEITCMLFETTKLEVNIWDAVDEDSDRPLPSLLTQKKELAGICILLADNDAYTYSLLHSMEEIPQDIPLFGGIAGTEGEQESYLFTDRQQILRGALLIGFLGRDLTIKTDISFGWNPLGPTFHITRTASENTIAELDYLPAHFIYKKYLAIHDKDFGPENLLFPLVIERQNQHMLRLPARVTQNGGIVLFGDCRQGERVRLAYGAPRKIMDALRDVYLHCTDFVPDSILLFNCTSRRFFLRDNTRQELGPFETIAPNAGFYTAGEVARESNDPVFLRNMTLVAACFREGPVQEKRRLEMPKIPEREELTGTLKLVEHLANFITVASSELETANKKLKRLATLDTLTGVYNRGEIEKILAHELEPRRQKKPSVSAIMLDLDDFKQVNDTYGHAVGDTVLITACDMMRDSVRRGDAVGRWGGEEFFIVLPDTTLDAAKGVAERIRKSIEKRSPLPDGKKVTASLGVAECGASESAMDFYRNLDSALYKAKKSGKNCVIAWE
ncbi:MAG: diguanylate cyclase [Desulfovibrio sp.]|nr:diguanylate cyclase [Desulfovibrio sp.]